MGAIKNPVKCKICAVVWSFTANHNSASAIHWEIFPAYGPKKAHWVMSQKVLHDWVRKWPNKHA